jgi:hypothetical protein
MPFCYCIRRSADITAIWKAGMVSWVWQVTDASNLAAESHCRTSTRDAVRPGRRERNVTGPVEQTLLLQSRSPTDLIALGTRLTPQ